MATPEERIAAARAKRLDLEAAAEARRAEAAAEAEADAEERALAEAEALDALEEKHGPLGREMLRVTSDGGSIIVKRPNHLFYRRFQDTGKTTTADFEKLVRPCVVYPSPAAFDILIQEYPVLITRCADAVCRLAGARRDDIEGK